MPLIPFLTTFIALTASPSGCEPINPGFEETNHDGFAASWTGDRQVYSVDTSVFHTGKASLKYQNADPNNYQLCSQGINLEPARIYEVSVWIKTQGIQGDESGATVCIEWRNKNGDFLGGFYPDGIKGDNNWTLLKGTTERIPKDAYGISLSCYVRQYMTGSAWWDDLRVARVKERPLSSVLMRPNYRGEIWDDGPDRISIQAYLQLADCEYKFPDLVLIQRLIPMDAPNAAPRETIVDPVASPTIGVSIPSNDLAPGRYSAEIALIVRASGEELAKDKYLVVRRPGKRDRKAYIDEHNRLILHGKPFFPLGMYWGEIDKGQLDVYADSPFNCLMPYAPPTQEQMDMADAHGLKVLYSVKDTYFGQTGCPDGIKSVADELPYIKSQVEKFRNHPALLAWYINDEAPLDILDRLIAHRQCVEDNDPNHPAWSVLCQVDSVRKYLPTFDVIGTDPYPIPSRPVAVAGEYTRETVDAVACGRPVWQVPQVFNWALYNPNSPQDKFRPPTIEEMRSMTWQCIAEGAMGIVFYSWFDIRRDPATPFEKHWPLVKKVAQEVKDMTPVLLSVEPVAKISVDPAAWLHILMKRHENKDYIILVNNERQPHQARLTFDKKPDALTDVTRGEDITIPSTGPVTIEMEALGVRILTAR